MSIGVNELMLLAIVTVGTLWGVRRTGPSWLGVLPFIVLIATVFSPEDIASTLLIAVPNALALGVGVRPAQRTTPGKSAS